MDDMIMEGGDNMEKYECDSCDTEFDNETDLVTTDRGTLLCENCRAYCENCEEWIHTDRSQSVDDEMVWCSDCVDSFAAYCESCETTVSCSTHYINDRDQYWCDSCTDHSCTWCDNCDHYTYDGCENCEPISDTINNYGYKPTPIFLGKSKTNAFYGVELETEIRQRGNLEAAAEKFVEIANRNGEMCYLKEDASISNGGYPGFEIVTHPMSFEYAMQNEELYNAVTHIRDNYEARSWDGIDVNGNSYLGLHIHISRKGFKSGAHMHRFLALIYKNSRPVIKVAGRKTRYASFADCYKYDEYDRPYLSLSGKLRDYGRSERYSAVNTGNRDTLELRFFRGTLSPAGIKSSIQLAHAMVEYTRDISVSDVRMGALDWEWFKSYVEDNNGIYPELYVRLHRAEGWGKTSLLEQIGE